MKTLKEIAIEIAGDIPEFLWAEGAPYECGVISQQIEEFARRLVAALDAQVEPVAWQSPKSRDSLVSAETLAAWRKCYPKYVVTHTVPLFRHASAPKLEDGK